MIILTKLQRPGVAEDFVVRSRLVERLEEGRSRKLTLISAPAGYGKSSLASAWLESTGYASIWYAMDETDADLYQFLDYLIAGLRQHAPDSCPQSHAFLQAVKLPPVSVIAASLINDLTEIDDPLLIVFDDYHFIEGSDSARLVKALIQHLPRTCHMVIITRQDPDLALMTLRARHEMVELRGSELRFTPEEATTFLTGALSGRLTAEVARLLAKKTEGWAVGLRLAALSLRNEEDAAQFVERLGTAQGGLVLEYLMSEALAHVTPATRDFLLKTSILKQFNPELCAALWDDDASIADVEAHIDALVRANLFLISIDGEHRWWRYHHLFQDLLQHELQRQLPAEAINELHRRASAWFARHDLIDEAIHHALAAGEVVGAAQLVEQNRHAILNINRFDILDKWLSSLPDEIVQQRPALLVGRAWISHFYGDYAALPSILHRVETVLIDDSVRGELDSLTGISLFWQGQGQRSIELFQRALEYIPRENTFARSNTETYLVVAYQMVGLVERAAEVCLQIIHQESENFTRKGRLLGTLTFVYLLSGRPAEADLLAHRLMALAAREKDKFFHGWASYLLGKIHYSLNNLELAVQHFTQAVESRYFIGQNTPIDSYIGLMLSYQALRQPDKANAILSQLLGYAQHSQHPNSLILARSAQARLLLLQGDVDSAVHLLGTEDFSFDTGVMLFWIELPRITHARVLVAQGTEANLCKGAKILEKHLQFSQATHNIDQQIAILPLLALTRLKQGQRDEALAFLEEAVILAEPGGWIRPFVELGPQIAGLLNELGRRGVAPAFIARIVDAAPLFLPGDATAGQSRLPEPLTDREMDVLTLMARRYRDKEIAEELFISPATVRRHASNIYQKLQVNGRRQAVGKAVALGILPSAV